MDRQCEVCRGLATKCCSTLDQPPLYFCQKHYDEHLREAHPFGLE